MYEAVFLLLIFECLAAGLLVSPLSASTRRVIVRTVEQSSLSAIARTPSKYVALALTAAWLYSLREVMNTQSRLDVAEASAAETLRLEGLLHKAQRNTLLCGAAALLLLVCGRLFSLLKEVNQLTATKEALAKQAEGASAAFKVASDERDALKAQLKSDDVPVPSGKAAASEPSSTTEAEDELERSKETISKLRERTSTLIAEKDAAEKSVEALKKQAAGLSAEYARVLAQKESLENKLADFELVLGDEVKKSK